MDYCGKERRSEERNIPQQQEHMRQILNTAGYYAETARDCIGNGSKEVAKTFTFLSKMHLQAVRTMKTQCERMTRES